MRYIINNILLRSNSTEVLKTDDPRRSGDTAKSVLLR